MKKKFYIINFLLTLAVFVGNYFYLTEGGLMLKALCSSGFASLGLLNLLYALLNKKKNLMFANMMSIGLILAMIGDIVLWFNFIIGAAFFAAGHICYLIAQCFLVKIKWQDYLVSGIIFAGAGTFILVCPLLIFWQPIIKWVCFIYALIISIMMGKAICNFIRKPNALTAILAFGSMLFFLSDLMLVFDLFIGIWDWTGNLCMATYYPAQCLLAYTIFQNAKKYNF